MDISIIIVNWNTRDLLHNCLASIVQTVGEITYEIIVVDNASSDGTVAMLRERWPQVRVIENSENRGFGAANNQAMRIMTGRYALLLNTDTVLVENAVFLLFSYMEAHPAAAMACGQLLNADGSKQNSVASFPTLLTLLTNTSLLEYLFPKRYPSKRYNLAAPVEVDSCIGACMIVRGAAIADAGMFDERYFFYLEETDWACQMCRRGWKIVHVPKARIYHFQGQSSRRDARFRIEFYRSRYQFLRKWRSPSYYMLAYGVSVARLLVNWCLSALAVVLTAGLHRGARVKWIEYSRIILWHLRFCPENELTASRRDDYS